MSPHLIRVVSAGLLVLTVAACSGAPLPPATAPTTDVNPITGSRGGSAGGGGGAR